MDLITQFLNDPTFWVMVAFLVFVSALARRHEAAVQRAVFTGWGVAAAVAAREREELAQRALARRQPRPSPSLSPHDAQLAKTSVPCASEWERRAALG